MGLIDIGYYEFWRNRRSKIRDKIEQLGGNQYEIDENFEHGKNVYGISSYEGEGLLTDNLGYRLIKLKRK